MREEELEISLKVCSKQSTTNKQKQTDKTNIKHCSQTHPLLFTFFSTFFSLFCLRFGTFGTCSAWSCLGWLSGEENKFLVNFCNKNFVSLQKFCNGFFVLEKLSLFSNEEEIYKVQHEVCYHLYTHGIRAKRCHYESHCSLFKQMMTVRFRSGFPVKFNCII